MTISKTQGPAFVSKLKMTSAPPPWKGSSSWAELGANAPLLVGIILGLVVGMTNEGYVRELVNWDWTTRPYRLANFDPYVLTPEAERALKPLASFRECAKDCPEMIVVPAGSFKMGSPATEKGHYIDEGPERRVVFAAPIAVSKFPVTFADWDACVSTGGCPQGASRRHRLGPRHATCHLRELGRRPRICGLALQDDRQALSPALRGGVGIFGARRHHDGLFLGRGGRKEQRQR